MLHAILKEAEHPVPGGQLGKTCGVSRQIIIKDIAMMKKNGISIQATPSGYLLLKSPATCIIACRHDAAELLAQELYTIIEGGGTLIDVFVQHPRYGTMRNELMLNSRRDVAQFLSDMRDGQPLCMLTDGLHMHTLSAPNEEMLATIIHRLDALGILVK